MSTSINKELTITRIIDAPRALVYKVWTDPLHLQQWWGPKNFTNPVCELDVRPGGNIYIDMTGPDGTIYPCLGNFIELVESEKIVFSIRSHEDKNGNAGLETLNTVTFTEWEGKTKLKLVAKVIKATPEVAQSLAGMEQGWTESIDRLEHHATTSNMPPIIMERIYNAPIALVWKALSNNNEMKKWYFQLPEFKPEVGFQFQFAGTSKDGKPKQHLCQVTEVVHGKKLTYSWAYVGVTGISFVTFELFAEGEKTRLKLTHAGLDTFPKENMNFERQNFEGGWATILGTWLKEFLEREFNAK